MSHSYSDLLTFQRCPKKYEYAVVRSLTPKLQKKVLTLGIMVHELLMGNYLGNYIGAYADLEAKTGDWLVDDILQDAGDVLHEAERYVDSYLDWWKDDEWEILHVEETFTATVDGVDISFTPDLVIRDHAGVWIVDHKTTVALPREDLPVGNFQAFLYSSVMRELYPDFKGFIFNYIRKKLPRIPRLTKTGERRVADVGRIDTTYEILRDFIMEEAPELMNDPTHRRRLAELKDESRFFWRQHIFVTDIVADETLSDVPVIVGQIEVCATAGRFPRSFLPYSGAQACDSCEFKPLCLAELQGYNTKEIEKLYEPRDMSHRDYDYEIKEF